jgi:hypothetical protein
MAKIYYNLNNGATFHLPGADEPIHFQKGAFISDNEDTQKVVENWIKASKLTDQATIEPYDENNPWHNQKVPVSGQGVAVIGIQTSQKMGRAPEASDNQLAKAIVDGTFQDLVADNQDAAASLNIATGAALEAAQTDAQATLAKLKK